MKLTFETFASTTHGLIRLVALLALLVASVIDVGIVGDA